MPSHKAIFPNGQNLDRSTKPSDFDMNGVSSSGATNNTRITRASLEKQHRDPTTELLRMHYKFGHVNFSRLRAMARNTIVAGNTKVPTDTCSPQMGKGHHSPPVAICGSTCSNATK
jgi:hypothetical protein